MGMNFLKKGKAEDKELDESMMPVVNAGKDNGEEAGEAEEAVYGKQEPGKVKKGGKAKRFAIVAAIAAVAVFLLCAYIYSLVNNRIMGVVAMVGDVTILDKYRDGEDNYVTFRAESYNMIPSDLNEKGITVRMERELYDAIAIDVKYGTANILFRVPYSVARKAGYEEEQANVQVLWTEDILNKYAWIKTVVWSAK